MSAGAILVLVPLLNPNEPEAVIAAVHVTEGQRVAEGDLLCTLETTKSTAEVAAEGEGYVVGLRAGRGDTVRAGDIFCYLAATPDWLPPSLRQPVGDQSKIQNLKSDIPEGLRITQPALALAQNYSLDLTQLPTGPLITEKMVRDLVGADLRASPAEGARAGAPLPGAPQPPFDPTAIIVYGGGGHGKSLIDLLRALGTYRIAGVVDDGIPEGEVIMGLPVLGGKDVLADLHAKGVRLAVNAVGGIGDVAVRIKVFQLIAEAGFACPAVAHPTSFVEPSAILAAGAQVFPHAYVGSEARLGYGAIVNTGSIVSHDCILGDYANISPGAMLAGGVTVGEGALVGMGVTVNLSVKIGAGARIGNSATLKSDVPAGSVVRAGTVWPE